MKYLDDHHRQSRGLVYRGQADSEWLLESSLLRQVKKRLSRVLEKEESANISQLAGRRSEQYGGQIMQSFRTYLGQTVDKALSNEDEWLLGRHHGLYSPILDWTRSPYIAAFFAAADVVMNFDRLSSGYFAVWSLSTSLFEEHKQQHEGSERERAFQTFEAAKLGNPRGIAQQGLGTFIYPDVDLVDLVSELSNEQATRDSLQCFRLPHSEAVSAVDHLYLMNIHFRSLYPDMDGLAMQANMNLHHVGYEGMGGFYVPPGFETLLP